jgi:hypothetical protein
MLNGGGYSVKFSQFRSIHFPSILPTKLIGLDVSPSSKDISTNKF